VANKAKASNQTRRETIEAMRRQQERAERRKTMIFVGIAIFVVFDTLARRLLGRWHDSELPRG